MVKIDRIIEKDLLLINEDSVKVKITSVETLKETQDPETIETEVQIEDTEIREKEAETEDREIVKIEAPAEITGPEKKKVNLIQKVTITKDPTKVLKMSTCV